jgi:periplasmic copper chaperone A
MTRQSACLAIGLLSAWSFGVQAAEIAIGDPYARAVPPGQPNSAVFMSLQNQSSDARALVGAESPVAEVVELHTHLQEGGMMRMRRIERIDLPAGERVALQPGGLHVMLIGLKQTLEPGASVALTLRYDDGGTDTIQAPVRRIEAPSMPHRQ